MLYRRAALIAFSFALALSAGSARAQTFVFHLSGDQEVPPVPSTATGGCHGELDQPAGTFEVFCSHGVSGATTMHIHRGAAGVNGPVAFDLGDPTSPVHATWTGMTPGDIAELLAGDLYVNVHTAGRPGGEIRGQILTRTVDTVAFDLEGGQVVPPVSTAATGSCLADLDDPATALSVDCTHDLAGATAAHVHNAPVGENGPQIFAFASPASPLAGVVPLTPLLVAEFAAGFLYVDVHLEPAMEGDPSGEIRGQIGDLPGGATTGTIRIEKVTFPAGGAGFGFTEDVPGSPGSFTLDDGEAEVFLGVAPGTYTVTEADPGTAPGGFVLSDLRCGDADSVADRSSRTATIALEAGELVTCTFTNTSVPAGATLFAFHLSGSQEVPPVPSSSSGGCAGLFDAGAAEFTLLCVHDVPEATVMHIHRAPAGANGPIAFDLGTPTSPVQNTWSGMSPADVSDLLAGNLYVNIHTSGRPGGEIRGQIVPRTFETFQFELSGRQVVPGGAGSRGGSCFAALNGAATELSVECQHDLAGAVSAHLHNAPAGETGPVLFSFSDPSSPFSAVVPLGLRDLAELLAGFLYVDVHAPEGSGGDLRGQVVVDSLTHLLEVPGLGTWGLLALTLALAALGLRRLAG